MPSYDEPIEIVEHRSEWAQDFGRERVRLIRTLGSDGEFVEHIGSTSVIGLPAKPIVDIAWGVRSFPPAVSLINIVCELGYEFLGEAGIPGRNYFRYRGELNFNLHAMQLNGMLWQNNLVLRDYLRSSPEACRRYARVKREAIASGHTSLISYSGAKGTFLVQLLQEAYAARPKPGKQ
jgi:GrpB-like predicted nucleotidyltransferase (UPF0157 family)